MSLNNSDSRAGRTKINASSGNTNGSGGAHIGAHIKTSQPKSSFANDFDKERGLNNQKNSPKPKGSKREKKPWDKKSKILLIIGIVLLVGALGTAGFIVKGYLDAKAEYDRLRNQAGIDTSMFDRALSDLAELANLKIDWDALRAENPDVVAWIYVQGTDISYPVAQSDDNDYYLTHSFSGARSSSGSIFLDCENNPDLNDMHNVLYGHNMLNGTMFAQILNFKDQDFLNNGYKILILTPTKGFVLQPAFTYICDGAEELRQLGFKDKNQLQTYITELMGHTVTESTVDTTKIDKMFSLVTCSYEAHDVRTVLCCVPTYAVTFPNGA